MDRVNTRARAGWPLCLYLAIWIDRWIDGYIVDRYIDIDMYTFRWNSQTRPPVLAERVTRARTVVRISSYIDR